MRFTLASVAVVVLTATLVAAPVPKDKEKVKDEDAIQGTWKIEQFDTGGAAGGPPPGEVEKIRFTFKKDGKLSMLGGPEAGKERDGEYKMDPKASPKSIDMTLEGRPALAIYELDGDTLKICMTEGDKAARPSEFKAGGMRTFVITFKRVKEEKKDEKKEERKDK
jgi:uncharacterized protein (TIGR03067 family)